HLDGGGAFEVEPATRLRPSDFITVWPPCTIDGRQVFDNLRQARKELARGKRPLSSAYGPACSRGRGATAACRQTGLPKAFLSDSACVHAAVQRLLACTCLCAIPGGGIRAD